MREYQQRKNNPYYLDRDIYMQIVYMIRGYDSKTLFRRRERVLYGTPLPLDGMPKGTDTGDPTADKAIRLANINTQIKAIDDTIIELSAKYEQTYTGEPFDALEAWMDYGVFCYYRAKQTRTEAPSTRTWKRYRSEFAYSVAKKLNYF